MRQEPHEIVQSLSELLQPVKGYKPSLHLVLCLPSSCCCVKVRPRSLAMGAAGALSALTVGGSEHNQGAIIITGALRLLVALLRSGRQPPAQEAASRALWHVGLWPRRADIRICSIQIYGVWCQQPFSSTRMLPLQLAPTLCC